MFIVIFKGIYDLFERTKRKQRKALQRSSPEFTARSIDKNKKRKNKREKEITFDPRETTVFGSVIRQLTGVHIYN